MIWCDGTAIFCVRILHSGVIVQYTPAIAPQRLPVAPVGAVHVAAVPRSLRQGRSRGRACGLLPNLAAAAAARYTT
jgi:hypothetical protein